jgi:hypothetical protein
MNPQPAMPGQLADMLLPDEDGDRLPPSDLCRRYEIYQQLRVLPDEAISRVQYLQPQIGCFNRCVFCSQHAGTEVWQLSRTGLRNFFAAVWRTVQDRPAVRGQLAAHRPHKPRVLFPYVDNDIGSYPYLDDYVALAHDLFQARVRITTVGFSSNSPELVAMHERIATELNGGLAGVRLSVTPFTFGWTPAAHQQGRASRLQFRLDTARMLEIYRPLLAKLGVGKESFAVELRFRPLVARVPVTDTVLDGRHVVLAGPHLLLAVRPDGQPPPLSRVVGVRNNIPGRRDQTVAPEPVFSAGGEAYTLVTSDTMASEGVERFARRAIDGDLAAAATRPVTVRLVDHPDGPYYAVDATFAEDGTMRTLLIYPATDRRASGYNDATRFFLNSLLEYKRDRGFPRRAAVPDATARDVAGVVQRIRRLARDLAGCDQLAAGYVRHEVAPLIADYGWALLKSGLPASLFFSRAFSIDTGQSINQGRGRVLFKGLTSTADVPANPWEERGYFISHSKGYVWRIAPMPYPAAGGGALSSARRGGKNSASQVPSLIIEEVDPRHVQPRDFDTGQPLRRYRITGVDLEHVTLDEGYHRYLLPGLRRAEQVD